MPTEQDDGWGESDGEILRAALEARFGTIEQAGEASGVTSSAIRRWISAESTPNRAKLRQVAHALGSNLGPKLLADLGYEAMSDDLATQFVGDSVTDEKIAAAVARYIEEELGRRDRRAASAAPPGGVIGRRAPLRPREAYGKVSAQAEKSPPGSETWRR